MTISSLSIMFRLITVLIFNGLALKHNDTRSGFPSDVIIKYVVDVDHALCSKMGTFSRVVFDQKNIALCPIST